VITGLLEERFAMLASGLAVVSGGMTAGLVASSTTAPSMGGRIDIFVSSDLATIVTRCGNTGQMDRPRQRL
jgi:hypothetical protein